MIGLGPGLLRDWKSLGVLFSRSDAAYLSPAAVLDGEDAVGQALLVPRLAQVLSNRALVLAGRPTPAGP